MSGDQAHLERPAHAPPEARSSAELITLIVSIAILVGIAGTVIVLFVRGGNDPPRVEIAPLLDKVRHESDAYYLPIAVTNRGDRTAKEVVIEVELASPSGDAETAEFTIDFLPSGAEEQGVVAFRQNPATGELTAAVVSFLSP